MANAKEEVTWPYQAGQPCIGVRFRNPDGLEYPSDHDEMVVIDTGNSNGIILPSEVYNILKLSRWEKPEPVVTILADGEDKQLIESEGFIHIPRLCPKPYKVPLFRFEHEGTDDKEILIGLDLINKFILTIDGPRQKLTIAK